MLARIGVQVELLVQTKSKYFAKVLGQNGYDTSFYLLGWTPSTFDANHTISAVMACRGAGTGAFNLGGYCNRRVTQLSGLIQVETDPDRRQPLLDEANRVHAAENGKHTLPHPPPSL